MRVVRELVDRLSRIELPRWLDRVVGVLRGVVDPLTPLGWSLVVVGPLAWWVGVRLGWDELLVVAAVSLLAVVLGLVWTLRRPSVQVRARLLRERVVVGEYATCSVVAENPGSHRSRSTRIELPVGRGRARLLCPSLASEATWESEAVTIETGRRGVIPVGPAAAVTGDPLGVARRELGYGDAELLHVHPVTTRLPSISAGWLRDLEGQTTQDLSNSDVAFHTLREYVPGDDRRHVHWRTTARLGTLMVRQFVDTRRSHLGLVLSTRPSDWADAEEFEFGVQVAGSLGRTALIEGQEVSTIAGGHALSSITGPVLLDGLAGVELADDAPTLPTLFHDAVPVLRAASIVAVVIGTTVDPREVRRMAQRFGPDTRVAAITCSPGADATRSRLGRINVLEVGSLDGLARVLGRGGGV